MKAKTYWYLAGVGGILFIAVSIISALVTATGALGADPGERVNRADFIWAAAGLVISVYCFYKLRELNKK
jgi:hypothetical protein